MGVRIDQSQGSAGVGDIPVYEDEEFEGAPLSQVHEGYIRGLIRGKTSNSENAKLESDRVSETESFDSEDYDTMATVGLIPMLIAAGVVAFFSWSPVGIGIVISFLVISLILKAISLYKEKKELSEDDLIEKNHALDNGFRTIARDESLNESSTSNFSANSEEDEITHLAHLPANSEEDDITFPNTLYKKYNPKTDQEPDWVY